MNIITPYDFVKHYLRLCKEHIKHNNEKVVSILDIFGYLGEIPKYFTMDKINCPSLIADISNTSFDIVKEFWDSKNYIYSGLDYSDTFEVFDEEISNSVYTNLEETELVNFKFDLPFLDEVRKPGDNRDSIMFRSLYITEDNVLRIEFLYGNDDDNIIMYEQESVIMDPSDIDDDKLFILLYSGLAINVLTLINGILNSVELALLDAIKTYKTTEQIESILYNISDDNPLLVAMGKYCLFSQGGMPIGRLSNDKYTIHNSKYTEIIDNIVHRYTIGEEVTRAKHSESTGLSYGENMISKILDKNLKNGEFDKFDSFEGENKVGSVLGMINNIRESLMNCYEIHGKTNIFNEIMPPDIMNSILNISKNMDEDNKWAVVMVNPTELVDGVAKSYNFPVLLLVSDAGKIVMPNSVMMNDSKSRDLDKIYNWNRNNAKNIFGNDEIINMVSKQYGANLVKNNTATPIGYLNNMNGNSSQLPSTIMKQDTVIDLKIDEEDYEFDSIRLTEKLTEAISDSGYFNMMINQTSLVYSDVKSMLDAVSKSLETKYTDFADTDDRVRQLEITDVFTPSTLLVTTYSSNTILDIFALYFDDDTHKYRMDNISEKVKTSFICDKLYKTCKMKPEYRFGLNFAVASRSCNVNLSMIDKKYNISNEDLGDIANKIGYRYDLAMFSLGILQSILVDSLSKIHLDPTRAMITQGVSYNHSIKKYSFSNLVNELEIMTNEDSYGTHEIASKVIRCLESINLSTEDEDIDCQNHYYSSTPYHVYQSISISLPNGISVNYRAPGKIIKKSIRSNLIFNPNKFFAITGIRREGNFKDGIRATQDRILFIENIDKSISDFRDDLLKVFKYIESISNIEL